MIAPRIERKPMSHRRKSCAGSPLSSVWLALGVVLLVACGGDQASRQGARSGGGSGAPPRAGGWPGDGGPPPAAVPVEVVTVERRSISSFIETNGTLEAENEVDIVARVTAPVVELKVEEGVAGPRTTIG